MTEPAPVARVCIACGDLFIPEEPNYRTCSMACSVKHVEEAMDEAARHLAGEETKR